MPIYKTGLCWLRRDLRWTDHTALKMACSQCKDVAVVFVFDSVILDQLDDSEDRRLTVIHRALEELNEALKKWGSRLIVLYGDPQEQIPHIVEKLKVDAVYFNEDYEQYAKKRDRAVKTTLERKGVDFYSFKDQVIFSGTEILKADGTPYQVFTPYMRAWKKKYKKTMADEQKPNLKRLIAPSRLSRIEKLKPLNFYGFQKSEVLFPLGRSGALKLLKVFEGSLKNYNRDRDFPALEGTSKLSVHLRFGTLSIREAVRFCLYKKNKGAEAWLNELIWREFYFMILDQFPFVEKLAFKEQYRTISWPGKSTHFRAWCEGRTGVPIVDAAMRQLNSTGFMHNRLRMVVASFLVKDLLIDWRKGEAYFAKKLLDFDRAANNGGWQWSASTGCDAQPYFRVFNPSSQQKKFDPDGVFLRQWVPEVFEENSNYPEPIINHKVQREKALKLFKGAALT